MAREDLRKLYEKVMHDVHDWDKGTYIVRLWDGMDGCWCDCTKAVSGDEALKVWCERTAGGKKAISFQEIDYFKIYPSDTRMAWDGEEGREMFR